MRRNLRTAFLLVLSLTVASSSFAAAKITIKNSDEPGVGFNDPTPATPSGGNPGTTVGEQRMNAFLEAARIWGEQLDSPIEIVIDASFAPLACTASGGTLGSAGPTEIFADFPNAPKAGVWYPFALANKLAGQDLNPGHPQIRARFNGKLGENGCLEGRRWYYGLDNNHGRNIDLVTVLLHEFAHGLGVIGGIRTTASSSGLPIGALAQENRPFIYDLHAFDTTSGLRMDLMSDTQRANALINDQKVVWDGDSVKSGAAQYLDAVATLSATNGGTTTQYSPLTGTFGGKLPRTGLNGTIVAATDVAEPQSGTIKPGTTLDGCSPYTNADAVRGNIAIVNEGRCNDVDKAKAAQAAGASALIIAAADSFAPYRPIGLEPSITIPLFGVTKKDGDVLRTGGVSGTFFYDLTRMSGADVNGLVKLYVPNGIEPGSTYSHFDSSATPNLLMEPNISNDLPHGVDLTLNLLLDIGWGLESGKPPAPAGGRRFLKRGGR